MNVCRRMVVFCALACSLATLFCSSLQGGEPVALTEGMSYVVSDELSTHRSFTEEGARLLIVDGDFLKSAL